MATEFRRKLYKRGSSFETTIPIQLLFALDKSKKYYVVFSYDPEANRWYVKFEDQKRKIRLPNPIPNKMTTSMAVKA